MAIGTESDFEQTTIERLSALGYEYQCGWDLDRPHEEVVLTDALHDALRARYPDLPEAAIKEAATRLSRPDGVDTLRRNHAFHRDLTKGFEVRVERPDGAVEYRHVYGIDWDEPGRNRFLVVNQLQVKGQNDRRPDIVVYVNGLPLVVFELKNPWDKQFTVEKAQNQLRHYVHEIPQIFDFNAFVVASDGVRTHHAMWGADDEWFAPWSSIDGVTVEPSTTASMKTLVEGLFPKDRLLEYVRDFIVFEEANEKTTKKGAKYHQFFAVRLAARRAIKSFTTNQGERRLGVIWHTTGSGKSLSMTFLVGRLRRHPALGNPLFVVQVDRTDLDNQLHGQFAAARDLVGAVKQAESVDDLRNLLRTEGGEVVFTTIEKFRLKEGETSHPVLNKRDNVIVIADEAHRSQYGFTKGYARHLAEALPNARRLGFTGTPINFSGADTMEVFGDVIHTYDIKQSQDDRATVQIFYEPRQVKLHLSEADIEEALKDIASEDPDFEKRKTKWAALAKVAGAKNRLDTLARDLLEHFTRRTETLKGKAMVVCMTRENCVRLYDALTALPGCPEVKVVMTGDLSEDPPEWSKAGHLTTKAQREAIKKRMTKLEDPLKIVIVCDMWLTGTDIPCLHTLYVDKPMRGHTMIQAISRVNRVFRDKPHGLIVDYIGIGDELREATNRYRAGGGQGTPAPEVAEQAGGVFKGLLMLIRSMLPDRPYGEWRGLSKVQQEDLSALVYGTLTSNDDKRQSFLDAELKLSNAFLLVRHLDEFRPAADEVIFYQRVRQQLAKALPGKAAAKKDVERAVRDLVDDTIEAEGVFDIYRVAGIEKPNLSILDNAFLQTFKDQPHVDLRLKLLEKLLADELHTRAAKNLTKTRSFLELLEKTLDRYHRRLIDAAEVVKTISEIHQELENDQRRAQQLGLSEEEIAFYDVITQNAGTYYDEPFLRDLVHDVVQSIKRNLKVHWTEPHRDDVKAEVRASVRRALRKKRVRPEDLDVFVARILEQAEAKYRYWPMAA